MDTPDGLDVDPALAAAMGFSSFGGQPTKKRKFNNSTKGFVDPDIGKTKSTGATGANNIPVRENKNVKTAGDKVASSGTPASTSSMAGTEKPSLEALRHGVRNERGDVAYFLPSFVEDPWRG